MATESGAAPREPSAADFGPGPGLPANAAFVISVAARLVGLHEQTLRPINSISVDILNVPRTGINSTQQEARKGVTAQRDARLASFQSGELE